MLSGRTWWLRKPRALPVRFALLVFVAVALSACGGETRKRESASKVIAFLPEYSECIRAEERDQMVELMPDSGPDVPDIPRECGNSRKDRAIVGFQKCTEEYAGSNAGSMQERAKAATAHAETCAERFPLPK